MTKEQTDRLIIGLLLALLIGAANFVLKVERMAEQQRQMEKRMDYFHGSAGR